MLFSAASEGLLRTFVGSRDVGVFEQSAEFFAGIKKPACGRFFILCKLLNLLIIYFMSFFVPPPVPPLLLCVDKCSLGLLWWVWILQGSYPASVDEPNSNVYCPLWLGLSRYLAVGA